MTDSGPPPRERRTARPFVTRMRRGFGLGGLASAQPDQRSSDPGEEVLVVTLLLLEQAGQEAVDRPRFHLQPPAVQSQEHVRREEGHPLVAIDKRGGSTGSGEGGGRSPGGRDPGPPTRPPTSR